MLSKGGFMVTVLSAAAILATGWWVKQVKLKEEVGVVADKTPLEIPLNSKSSAQFSQYNFKPEEQAQHCSERIGFHPDHSKLISRRRDFFEKSENPHVFYLVHYAKLVPELLNEEITSDIIFKQLADDLYCALPFDQAQAWLKLIPQAKKDFEFSRFASEVLEEFEGSQNFSADKLLGQILQMKDKANELGANFNLEYVASELLEVFFNYSETQGLEAALTFLDTLNRKLNDEGTPQPLLVLISAKLQIDHGNAAAALPTLEKYLENEHPSIAIFSRQLQEQAKAQIEQGERQQAQAPDFSAKIVHGDGIGKNFSLHDYKGRSILLSFWAPWCSPCVSKLQHIEAVYQELKDKGVIILGVSQIENATSETEINRMREKYNVHFPQILDTADIFKKYDVKGLPHMVLIDPEGKISKILLGGQTEKFEEALGLVN